MALADHTSLAPPDSSVSNAQLELARVFTDEERHVLLFHELKIASELLLQHVEGAHLLVCFAESSVRADSKRERTRVRYLRSGNLPSTWKGV